ncbi:DUF1707 domain-containing protein [Blastococcus sp. CT_GayMR19]|nr:DUF1707 domain-containing protein [Blastococcus sp. CT_GayMR19]
MPPAGRLTPHAAPRAFRARARVSDAERAVVQERLRRAVGDGQLDLHEFDVRVQSAWSARTRGRPSAWPPASSSTRGGSTWRPRPGPSSGSSTPRGSAGRRPERATPSPTGISSLR